MIARENRNHFVPLNDARVQSGEGDATPPKKRPRLPGMFGDLSGAEEEDEMPRINGGDKRGLPEEATDDAAAGRSKMSRMTTKSVDGMIRLLKSLGTDEADKVSESSSDAGEMSGESSAESEAEDMFKVEALPRSARHWITEQDVELDRVRQLAGFLREQPLLPPHPEDPKGLRPFDDLAQLDAGVHLPFSHCAFKNCTWHVVLGGLPPLLRGGSWRGEAPEFRVRMHLMSAHRDVFVECIGEAAVQRQEILDYYEEALKHKCRECMPITSLSQDRRSGEYLSAVYNDESIHCYMCFVCGEKHLHLAGFDRLGDPSHYKGSIEYVSIGQLMQSIDGNDQKWDENLDFEVWKARYAPKLPKGQF